MRRTLLILSLLVISGLAAACSAAPTAPSAQRESAGIRESGFQVDLGITDTIPKVNSGGGEENPEQCDGCVGSM